jgi:hypothetical protein
MQTRVPVVSTRVLEIGGYQYKHISNYKYKIPLIYWCIPYKSWLGRKIGTVVIVDGA